MKIEYPAPPDPEYLDSNAKLILDACCGSRMFWFNKAHPNAVYMDNRELDETLCDGRRIVVKPDVIGDFRHMPFPDGSFRLVVFDPPHLKRAGERGWMKKKYGCLNRNTWREDIRAGFRECFRVLVPCGILIFKWNEDQIPIHMVVPLSPERPLFGQKGGKTHWLTFMKPLEAQPTTQKPKEETP